MIKAYLVNSEQWFRWQMDSSVPQDLKPRYHKPKEEPGLMNFKDGVLICTDNVQGFKEEYRDRFDCTDLTDKSSFWEGL